MKSFIFNTFKRYSFIYLGGLTAATFLIVALVPSQINPLSPQEVLAKVLENYESVDGVYYEKLLREIYKEDQLMDTQWIKTYSDDVGRFLELSQDPKTEEVESVYLKTFDSSENDRVYESSSEKDETGNFIYCVEVMEPEGAEANDSIGRAHLTLQADDYSKYQLGGGVGAKFKYEEQEEVFNQLMDLKAAQPSRAYIQELLANKHAYDARQLELDGQSYYLFESGVGPNQVFRFYINLNTYQLDFYEIHDSVQVRWIQKNTILNRDYLDPLDHSDLFDPDRFENLKEVATSTLKDPYDFNESGCYDHLGKRLDDSIIEEFPLAARKAWQGEIDQIEIQLDPDKQIEQGYISAQDHLELIPLASIEEQNKVNLQPYTLE